MDSASTEFLMSLHTMMVLQGLGSDDLALVDTKTVAEANPRLLDDVLTKNLLVWPQSLDSEDAVAALDAVLDATDESFRAVALLPGYGAQARMINSMSPGVNLARIMFVKDLQSIKNFYETLGTSPVWKDSADASSAMSNRLSLLMTPSTNGQAVSELQEWANTVNDQGSRSNFKAALDTWKSKGEKSHVTQRLSHYNDRLTAMRSSLPHFLRLPDEPPFSASGTRSAGSTLGLRMIDLMTLGVEPVNTARNQVTGQGTGTTGTGGDPTVTSASATDQAA